MPGPNWRSLSTPAVLPVETDVLPEDFGRANAFEEANHSIVFTVSTDEAAAETVAQMVAQRIAGDFQLYQKPGEVMSGRKGAGMSIGATLGSAHRVYYAMSMGHRIHEITYDERASKRIDVKVRNAPPSSRPLAARSLSDARASARK